MNLKKILFTFRDNRYFCHFYLNPVCRLNSRLLSNKISILLFRLFSFYYIQSEKACLSFCAAVLKKVRLTGGTDPDLYSPLRNEILFDSSGQ